jgi:hypothetical protein
MNGAEMPRRNKTGVNRPFTFNKSCQNKRSYKSEQEASNVAEIQMLEDMNLELAVYKCNECTFWHLTRRVSKRGNSI